MLRLSDWFSLQTTYAPRYRSVKERPLAVHSEIFDQPRRVCTPDPYTPDNAHYQRNFGRRESEWLQPSVVVPPVPVEVPAWS